MAEYTKGNLKTRRKKEREYANTQHDYLMHLMMKGMKGGFVLESKKMMQE